VYDSFTLLVNYDIMSLKLCDCRQVVEYIFDECFQFSVVRSVWLFCVVW